MSVPLLVLLLVAGAGWGVLTILRLRRRHYLAANRTRVIKESLARAQLKQREHSRPSERPAPPPGGGALD